VCSDFGEHGFSLNAPGNVPSFSLMDIPFAMSAFGPDRLFAASQHDACN